MQIPLDSPSSPERGRLRSKAIETLSRTYGHVKPGETRGQPVELERSRIGRRLRFTYDHEDLDGLVMVWVGGNWYRVIEIYE